MIFLSTLFTISPGHKKDATRYLNQWLQAGDGVYLFNYRTGVPIFQHNPDQFKKRFPGGSIFKLISTLYLLEHQGEMAQYLTEKCSGVASFYGKIGRCWQRKGHGITTLHRALIHSCNHFYYHQYGKIDPEEWLMLAHHLGVLHHLEQPPDSPFLYAGVPPELTINYYEAASLITFFAVEPPRREIQQMKLWLREVVTGGTAVHTGFKQFGLSGKTGTGLDRNGAYNGVFIGYLTDYPLGIVVNLKGKIGSNAAMIASDIFYLLFRKKRDKSDGKHSGSRKR